MSKEMVVTLIAPEEFSHRLYAIQDIAIDTIHRAGFVFCGKETLSVGQAIDIFFMGNQDDQTTLQTARTALTEALSSHPVDWFAQVAEDRKKSMLIADMDSTMITIECIDELADFAGIKDSVAKITESAMQGEIDFETALKDRVALLKGMDTNVLETCYNTRVGFSRGARRLVKTMRGADCVTALVSGGFTFFTAKVSDHLGFGFHRANKLEMADNKLTGNIVPPISDAATKLSVLNELATQGRIAPEGIIAVGDGANDIPMIEAAGIGVAYRAKPKAQEAADFCINHTDLLSVLYIQGYKPADFWVETHTA